MRGEPQENEDAEHEQLWERVAAIDVAKASGMVCTRVPHPSWPGRRLTRVQEVAANDRGGHRTRRAVGSRGHREDGLVVHVGLLADLVLPAGSHCAGRIGAVDYGALKIGTTGELLSNCPLHVDTNELSCMLDAVDKAV